MRLLRQVLGWQSLKETFTMDWLTTLLFVCWMASFLALAVGWLRTSRLYWLVLIPLGFGFQVLTLWRAHWYELGRHHQAPDEVDGCVLRRDDARAVRPVTERGGVSVLDEQFVECASCGEMVDIADRHECPRFRCRLCGEPVVRPETYRCEKHRESP